MTISMVCGNVAIAFNVPKNRMKCPTLKLMFGVLTMDANGFITWPTDFNLNTKAALRKQACMLLGKMMEDPENPVDDSMRPALTEMGGAVRALPPPRAPAQA